MRTAGPLAGDSPRVTPARDAVASTPETVKFFNSKTFFDYHHNIVTKHFFFKFIYLIAMAPCLEPELRQSTVIYPSFYRASGGVGTVRGTVEILGK